MVFVYYVVIWGLEVKGFLLFESVVVRYFNSDFCYFDVE